MDRDLYAGFIRLHILHHAAKEPIYGLWMIEELRRHGYDISPGTMYPILHGLERKGYLVSTMDDEGGRRRKLYRITDEGAEALKDAQARVRELVGEVFPEQGAQHDGT